MTRSELRDHVKQSWRRQETKMKMHESVTADRVMEACQRRITTLDNPGFCVSCGADADDCEPDARYYECENCGERKVFGAEELMLAL